MRTWDHEVTRNDHFGKYGDDGLRHDVDVRNCCRQLIGPRPAAATSNSTRKRVALPLSKGHVSGPFRCLTDLRMKSRV